MAAVKLYLDEMIPVDLVLILKQFNHNILSAKDAGMLGKSDSEQLAFATFEDRAVLTFNISDFTKLHRVWLKEGKQHKGIIISPEIKIAELIRLTLKLLAVVKDRETDNQLRFFQEFQ